MAILTIRNQLPEAEKQNKIVNILENLYRQTNTKLKDDPRKTFIQPQVSD